VGLFLVPIYSLWKVYKKELIDSHLLGLGAAFLVAHFIHNAFVFENPTSYLYFFFFLAFLNSISADNPETGTQKQISIGLIVTIVIVIFLLVFSTNINPARANKNSLNAIRLIYLTEDATAVFNRALETSTPHVDDIRLDFARTISQSISNYSKKNTAEGVAMLELSYKELDNNLMIHPLDIRNHIQKAQVAFLLASIKNQKFYLQEAEILLEEALELSPKRQQLEYMLAMNKLDLNKSEEGIEILKSSIDNNPNIAEGWWRLASVYKSLGNHEKALEILQEAFARGVKFDRDALNEVMRIAPEAIPTSTEN